MATAPNRSHETRFKPGNEAARRHGLRAGTRKELRRRDARTSRLLGKYLGMRADMGRPIGPTQLPLARRYVELELRCRDLYAALHEDPMNVKLHEMHISATRAQSALAAQLGESVATQHHLAKLEELARKDNWREAQKRLRGQHLGDGKQRPPTTPWQDPKEAIL